MQRQLLNSKQLLTRLVRLASNPATRSKIDDMVKGNRLAVFMKGTPNQPLCGFSNAVVQILSMHGLPAGSYFSVNVLEDDQIRQGIKEYSNWPTIPQIFIDGDFVGGCDVLIEMHKSGEIVKELDRLGIKSKLADEYEK